MPDRALGPAPVVGVLTYEPRQKPSTRAAEAVNTRRRELRHQLPGTMRSALGLREKYRRFWHLQALRCEGFEGGPADAPERGPPPQHAPAPSGRRRGEGGRAPPQAARRRAHERR